MNPHPVEQIALWVEGVLDGEEAREVELHVTACPSCREVAENCRGIGERVANLGRSEATFLDLQARLVARSECDSLEPSLLVGELIGGHLETCQCCRERSHRVRELGEDLRTLCVSRATFAELRRRLRPKVKVRTQVAAAAAAALIVFGLTLPPRRSARPPARPVSIVRRIDTLDEGVLRDTGLRVRGEGLIATVRIGEILVDPVDSAEAYAAIRVLRHVGTPSAEDLLHRALGRVPGMDGALLRALVELRSRRTTPILVRRLERQEARISALGYLAAVGDPAAIPAIATVLDDSEHGGRAGEILALYGSEAVLQEWRRSPKSAWFLRVSNPRVREVLILRARNDSEYRADSIRVALRCDDAGAEFLMEACEWEELKRLPPRCVLAAVRRGLESDRLQTAAIRAVGECELRSLSPSLMRGVLSEGFEVRASLMALARGGGGDSIGFLLDLLAYPKLAFEAERALARVPAASIREVAIRKIGRSGSEDAMIESLSRWDAPELGPFFVKALRLSRSWRKACEALGRWRYRPAVPALIALVERGSEARDALREITGEDFGSDRGRWNRWWKKHS